MKENIKKSRLRVRVLGQSNSNDLVSRIFFIFDQITVILALIAIAISCLHDDMIALCSWRRLLSLSFRSTITLYWRCAEYDAQITKTFHVNKILASYWVILKGQLKPSSNRLPSRSFAPTKLRFRCFDCNRTSFFGFRVFVEWIILAQIPTGIAYRTAAARRHLEAFLGRLTENCLNAATLMTRQATADKRARISVILHAFSNRITYSPIWLNLSPGTVNVCNEPIARLAGKLPWGSNSLSVSFWNRIKRVYILCNHDQWSWILLNL